MQVLYVEDNEVNRRVMKAILDSSGAEMFEAVDGIEGVEKVDANSYDLVLMDLRMPRMDGLDAIKAIRARDDSKARTPIIVVTADAAANVRKECLAVGADEVLSKPVGVRELFATIGEVLAKGSQLST